MQDELKKLIEELEADILHANAFSYDKVSVYIDSLRFVIEAAKRAPEVTPDKKYTEHFLEWRTKYFKGPKIEPVWESSVHSYTEAELHDKYERAMRQSPFKSGNPEMPWDIPKVEVRIINVGGKPQKEADFLYHLFRKLYTCLSSDEIDFLIEDVKNSTDTTSHVIGRLRNAGIHIPEQVEEELNS